MALPLSRGSLRHPRFPAAQGRSNPFPALLSPSSHSVASLPPHSCWEWRLHFSCHLHSQSIRTPQLSRLAELGGRRRRERVLWGLSPPHRSHSAPDCFLLRRAQPADQGGAQEPLELALPPRQAGRPTAGARGGRGARGRAGDWRPSRWGRPSHAPANEPASLAPPARLGRPRSGPRGRRAAFWAGRGLLAS